MKNCRNKKQMESNQVILADDNQKLSLTYQQIIGANNQIHELSQNYTSLKSNF
jgi:hypothetical protein